MYLKSLTLKGFKSFPERTRLEFGPGVSVVVGPNGSGKSNITDAVLWVLGEQSPLAVRGSSMQDVIFGGGPSVQARSAAEVEIVLDNADGALPLPWSEISVLRRLERSGEGEYRLGGARCRLIDVIEALSDTGLGKETHSVVSQGRIESIVTAKPRERRMLIEEAAGLSKHRTRRRRAQLKLERTQANLDRAVDVEHEARRRLRPLARQAQAAELHGRLERQGLEARLQLARHAWLAARAELVRAQARVEKARAERAELDSELQTVMERRATVERKLTDRAEERDALTDRVYSARSALERLRVRAEQVRTLTGALNERAASIEQDLTLLEGSGGDSTAPADCLDAERRVQALEERLAEIEDRQTEVQRARGSWETGWAEVRKIILEGIRRVLALTGEEDREQAVREVVDEAERTARAAVEQALAGAGAGRVPDAAGEDAAHALERHLAEPSEQERRTSWLLERRRAAAEHGPLAVRRAQLEGELDAERRLLERVASERAEHAARVESLRARRTGDLALTPSAARLARAIEDASDAVSSTLAALQAQLAGDRSAGAEIAEALRECAHDEAEVQSRLRACAEGVTEAELEAQRTVASASETEAEVRDIARRLELPMDDDELARGPALPDDQLAALALRLERIGRRRDQLGPVNPLAGEQYADAQAHVEEIVGRREDLEAALRELRSVIGEADRQIRETFDDTFHKVAHNFQDVIGDVFPDGSGRLRLVEAEIHSAPVLGDAAARPLGAPEEDLLGVEIEVTPAGKTTKRMSLLSGGEKSMAALAFLFAVFMARPCPFYVLDEVEAALDDLNLDRFLALLRRCATRAQFIVMTHQRLTMQAANWLYGVSMGGDGVSKVISRRLDGQDADTGAADRAADGPSGTALAPAEAVRLAGELQALST